MNICKAIRVIASAFVLSCAGEAFAALSTVYVDKTADALSADGTEGHPYVTIQAGIDNVEAGGTVYVAPGVYDEGSTNTFTGCDSRILIWKSLTLQATGGRTETVIPGAAATTGKDNFSLGLGDDAIRCVTVAADTTVYINGFTICEGRTHYDNGGGGDDANIGGGVFGAGQGKTFVQDCIIRGCYATRGGGAHLCRVIRSFVTLCKSSNVGACLRYSQAFNSIFTRNGGTGDGYGLFGYSYALVNCTVVENLTQVWQSQSGAAVNCAFFRNGTYGGSDSYASINCVSDDPAVAAMAKASNCRTASYESCIFAPLTNDFRIIASSDCDATGDYTMNGLSSYTGATMDFFGNPRRNTREETVNVGAIQATVTPQGAPVILGGTTFAGTQVVGAESNPWFGESGATSLPTHLWQTESPVYPSAVKLRLPGEGDSLGNLLVTNTAGDRVFINYDNTVWLPRYPLGADGTPVAHFLLTVGRTDNVCYVDAAAADGGDGSKLSPFNTLQPAGTKLKQNNSAGIIFVKRGRYDKGGAASGNGSTTTNRLSLGANGLVRVVATDGPELTTIVGASDANGVHGTGPGAIRCVESVGAGIKILSGFTLADGRTDTPAGAANRGGAAYKSYNLAESVRFFLTDCVITNCTGVDGSVSYSVDMVRCRITDCGRGFDTPLMKIGSFVSTLVWNCGPGKDAAASSRNYGEDVSFYNVTLGAASHAKGATPSVTCNSVFDTGTSSDVGSGVQTRVFHNNLYRTSEAPIDPSTEACAGSVQGPACFKNAAKGDHTLLAMSDGHGLARWSEMQKGCPVDAFGVPFVGTADGRFIAGAVEGSAPGVWIDSSYAGGVEPAESCGFDDDGMLTLTATKASTRPLLGFEVNGALVETRNPNFTLRMTDYPGVDAFRVTATYGTEFFVDAVNGKATNSGHYPDDAKLTIASAMDLTEDDDTVVALPGDYAADTPVAHKAGATILSRVIVPAKRTLRSRDGAATTAIVGAAASIDKGLGCGVDAVRCAFVKDGGRLLGFTLRDGHTDFAAASSEDSDDLGGGGVLGGHIDRAVVEDCVITRCSSYRGGGARTALLRRCRLVDNQAGWFGSAANNVSLQRCFVDGNVGGQTYVCYGGRYESCTFGPNNFYKDGTTPANVRIDSNSTTAYMRSCIFSSGVVYATWLSDCAFAEGMTPQSPNAITGDIYGEVQLDANGAPVVGHNVGIDRATPAHMSDDVLAMDLTGSTRIWNAAYDMGAIEADWRAHYSRSLCRRRLTVTDAPESAMELDNGQIRLVEGTLTATWTAVSGMREISYEVPGRGVLTVSVDGVVVDTLESGGSNTYRFSSAAPSNVLSFSYQPGESDMLGAAIGPFAGRGGMILMVR